MIQEIQAVIAAGATGSLSLLVKICIPVLVAYGWAGMSLGHLIQYFDKSITVLIYEAYLSSYYAKIILFY